MGIFHSHIGLVSRPDNSSIQRAAYISGQQLYDHRIGKFCERRRHDVLYSEIMLPPCTPKEFYDRETLWNAKEWAERYVNGRTAIEVEASIHTELLHGEQQELDRVIKFIRDCFSEVYLSQGRCIDWSIHDKGTGNPHFHALLTDRPVDNDGFCQKKDRTWNSSESYLLWREMWVAVQNLELERRYPDRYLDMIISPDSYFVQGKFKEAKTKNIHLGPRVKALCEREGIVTDRMAEHLAILEARKKEQEQELEAQKSQDQEREFERTR